MGSTTANRELLFGERLVERGLSKPEQVEECLRIQADLRSQGVTPVPRLGELLVYKGYLAAERMREAAESIPMNSVETAPTWKGPSPNLDRVREGIQEHEQAREERSSSSSHYELLELLGQGGMGIVYRARDLKLNRVVALKFLHSGNPDDGRRFLREGMLAAQLSHPHIVTIHEVGEMDGKPYIAMEYIPGKALSELRLEPRQAAEIVRDAAEAVHYAHQKGIIHRDLKPANILVSDSSPPRAYVMDFGLAKQAAAGSSLSLTGTVMGTPSYMPPEQAQGRVHAVTARSDVYSLGATLYAALTGRPPFSNDLVYEVLRQVTSDDPVPVRKIRSRVARDLEAIVMKCLEKNPERRYPGAGELAQDLTRYLNGEAILAHPLTVLYRLRKYAWRKRAAILVAALAFLGSSSFFAYRWADQGEARGWQRAARRHFDQGEFDLAMQYLNRAATRIAVDPEFYRRCQEKLEVRKTKEEAMRIEDDVFGPMLKELDVLPATAEGWTRAVVLLSQGLARHPDSWFAWFRKARCHEFLFEYEAAQEAYRRAYSVNPRLLAARRARGQILMDRLDRREEAASEFEAALGPDWDPGDALAMQARVAIIRGDYGRALELCREAEKGPSRKSEVFFLRGCVYGDRTRSRFFDPTRAVDEFTRAIEIESSEALTYMNRGVAQYDSRDFDRAVADFAQALKLNHRLPQAHSYSAMAFAEKGDLDGALHQMGHAIRLHAKNSEYFRYRASLHARKAERRSEENRRDEAVPEWNAALADYGKVLELDPRNAETYDACGNVRQSLGDFDGAIAAYAEALRIKPEFALAYSNRGHAYRQRGERRATEDRRAEAVRDWQEAMNDFNRALEIDSNLPEGYSGRASVWLSLAPRSPEARTLLEQAAQDLETALHHAPEDWTHRFGVRRDLERIRDEIRRLSE